MLSTNTCVLLPLPEWAPTHLERIDVRVSHSQSLNDAAVRALASLQPFSFTGSTSDAKLANVRALLNFVKPLLPTVSFTSVKVLSRAVEDRLRSLSQLDRVETAEEYPTFPFDCVSFGTWRKTHNSFDEDPVVLANATGAGPAVFNFAVRTRPKNTIDALTEINLDALQNLCFNVEVQCGASCGTFPKHTWFLLTKVAVANASTIFSSPAKNYLVVAELDGDNVVLTHIHSRSLSWRIRKLSSK
jgi:hypothetical protein